MAEADVIENTFGDDMIDDDDDREMVPLRNLGCDDDGNMTPLHETVFTRMGVEIKVAFIDSILKKYGGGLDSTIRALLRPQLTHENRMWYYNT
jgi:hypothetical protein